MSNAQLGSRDKFNWYGYACGVWLANLILVVLSYFIPGMFFFVAIMFIAIIVGFGSAFVLSAREGTDVGDALAESAVWCWIAAGITVVYVIINVIGCVPVLREGGPYMENGRYYLYNHRIVREITKSEYRTLQIAQGRLFSGCGLVFSTLSLMFHSGRRDINEF